VPFLILGAACSSRCRSASGEVVGASGAASVRARTRPGGGPAFAASVYGGYFGAGLGVILHGVVLGLVLEDSLTRVNALKQALSFCVNVTAAAYFLFSGEVVWSAALVMAVAALVGGTIGGRFAGRMPPDLLRRIVVAIGLVVGVAYLVEG
jgi:uncharacterized membrane protein YfcA